MLNRVTTVDLNPSCRLLSSKIGGIVVVVYRVTEHLLCVVQKLILIEIEKNWQSYVAEESIQNSTAYHGLPQLSEYIDFATLNTICDAKAQTENL